MTIQQVNFCLTVAFRKAEGLLIYGKDLRKVIPLDVR